MSSSPGTRGSHGGDGEPARVCVASASQARRQPWSMLGECRRHLADGSAAVVQCQRTEEHDGQYHQSPGAVATCDVRGILEVCISRHCKKTSGGNPG